MIPRCPIPAAGASLGRSSAVSGTDREQERAAREVPIRFEGLPAEYLQVDWGEIRRFPFTQQPPATRYVLCCRLNTQRVPGRWVWLRWTEDMRQETLLRGLIACFGALSFVPWVLVFDNITQRVPAVTSGRDASNQPVWTPALVQLAAEFGFHPQACDPGAGNQKEWVSYCTSVLCFGDRL